MAIPVFVGEPSAIGSDSELSQKLTELLFDLAAFHDPLIADAFTSSETVTVINSWIIKPRHSANNLTPCNKRSTKYYLNTSCQCEVKYCYNAV